MATIAFVEDDAAIRDALSDLLRMNGHVPLAVTDYANATDVVLEEAPDLVLLDLNLPDVDGTLLCREIRARSSVPIIVVTSRAGEVDEVMCMTMGADDFVPKPYSGHVLLARIEAVLRRAGGLVSSMLCHGVLTVDVMRSAASTSEGTVELTRNELRILALLMRHAGTIVPRETIMCELWDSDAFVDDNTLTVNINRLRAKLASLGVKDYLTTHRGQGYSV